MKGSAGEVTYTLVDLGSVDKDSGSMVEEMVREYPPATRETPFIPSSQQNVSRSPVHW